MHRPPPKPTRTDTLFPYPPLSRVFPPIREGRVGVRGNHVTGRRPAGSVELVVDAARAFGSGSHATTALCLRALQDTIRRDRPRRILDLGCGPGILAMAAAKLVPTAQVVAEIGRAHV